jgi:hypothetical protein
MTKKPKPLSETVSVRLSRKNYEMLRERTKYNGYTLKWLLNHCVELYFQDEEKK